MEIKITTELPLQGMGFSEKHIRYETNIKHKTSLGGSLTKRAW